MKRIAVVLLLLPLLLMGALARAAPPTVEAVQTEIKAGRYEQAESMMREVVQARPKSARAHYVLAEILAHNGRVGQAAEEAAQARQLDPAIGFTDAAKFARFEEMLKSRSAATAQPRVGGGVVSAGTAPLDASTAPLPPQRSTAAPRQAERSSGVPGWLWLGGLVLIGVVAWRMLASRRQAATSMVGAGGAAAGYPMAAPGTGMQPGYAPGMQPGYGPGMQPGAMAGRGGGLMGVGLGVAGGVAAGMLAERMLHGNEAHAATPPDAGTSASGGGGMSPGMFDDGQNDALRDRPVDFGTGGADWDAGGGSVDLGSGGGSGGGDDGW